MGTAIVLLVLCAIVGAVIYKMVKDKRSGKSSCGGNCAGCGMACHQSKEMKQYLKGGCLMAASLHMNSLHAGWITRAGLHGLQFEESGV